MIVSRNLMFATLAMSIGLLPAAGTSAAAPEPITGFAIFTDSSRSVPGFVGSYVDRDLRLLSDQSDWRDSQSIAGTRIDMVDFDESSEWGSRASVGVTGGTDLDWDFFSVQWDGYLHVTTPGVRMSTLSDDGGRMCQNSFISSGSSMRGPVRFRRERAVC